MTLFAFSLNLPMPWLTERVNLRHYIFCVPLKVPQRGKNRSGFPSNSRHFVLSAQNKMCERFHIFRARETALSRGAPLFGNPLPCEERVNARHCILCVPSKMPRREKIPPLGATPTAGCLSHHGKMICQHKSFFVNL